MTRKQPPTLRLTPTDGHASASAPQPKPPLTRQKRPRGRRIDSKTLRATTPHAITTPAKTPQGATTAINKIDNKRAQAHADKILGPVGAFDQFSAETWRAVCDLMAQGWSLRRIGKMPGFPNCRTIMRWLRFGTGKEAIPQALRDRYSHALEERGESLGERITDLAKRVESGMLDPHAGRVAIDAYKWAAGRLAPSRYGANQHITVDSRSINVAVETGRALVADDDLRRTAQGIADRLQDDGISVVEAVEMAKRIESDRTDNE